MPISRYISGDPSAGTAAPDDLLPPAATDPEQTLASGSTTATVEFTHTSPGGTGSKTYAITIKDEGGSSVTPDSGSGLGPYVFPVSAGKSYRVRLRATDSGSPAQIADGAAMVHVAAAPEIAGWELVFDGDFASVTPATKTGSGNEAIVGGDFDGVTWSWKNNSSNNGTAYLTTDGIKVVGGAGVGSYEIALNVSNILAAEDSDDFVVALYLRDIAGVTGTTRGIRAGISTTGDLTTSQSDGMKAQYTSSGNWTPNIMKNDTTTTSYGGTVAIATEGRLLVRCVVGRFALSAWAAGSSALPDDAAIAALFLHQASESAKAAVRYGAALWVGVNGIFIAEVELYRVAIYKRGIAS